MSLFYNTKFAAFVLAVVCVSSFLLGGTLKLNALRNDAIKVFEQGSHGDGIGVARDIHDIQTAAHNIYFQVSTFIDDDSVTVPLNKAVLSLMNAKNADERMKGIEGMDSLAAQVVQAARGVLPEDNMRFVNSNHDRLTSAFRRISLDKYNTEAAPAFNRNAETVPSNIFFRLGFVKKLHTR
jgi:hypothetical protein